MNRPGKVRTRLAFFAVTSVIALAWGCSGAGRVQSSPPLRDDRTANRPRSLAAAEGLTMSVIPGPLEFRMGSPETEVGRNPASDSPDETRHTARIPRSYAISTHEVTVAQFQRFLDAHPEVKSRHAYPGDSARMGQVMQRFSPDPDGPQIAVTWYEAAMFCNWLSE